MSGHTDGSSYCMNMNTLQGNFVVVSTTEAYFNATAAYDLPTQVIINLVLNTTNTTSRYQTLALSITNSAYTATCSVPIVYQRQYSDTSSTITPTDLFNGVFAVDSNSCVPSSSCCCGKGNINITPQSDDGTDTYVLLDGQLDGGSGLLLLYCILHHKCIISYTIIIN